MARSAQHRDRLIQTAIRLFRQQGYASTGLAEILARSGAPKGSLYHYFPGGKEEIGAVAVAAAGRMVARTLEDVFARTTTSAEFVAAYSGLLAHWSAASDFREGCPIATTMLETRLGSSRIADAGREAFENWLRLITRAFERDGLDASAARDRATVFMAAIEGALLLARVQRSTAPLERVARAFG